MQSELKNLTLSTCNVLNIAQRYCGIIVVSKKTESNKTLHFL